MILHRRKKAGAPLRPEKVDVVIAGQMLNQLTLVFRPRFMLSQLSNTYRVIAAKKLYSAF
jgi:hypothetical protein